MNYLRHVFLFISFSVCHILFIACQEYEWISPQIVHLTTDHLHIKLSAFNKNFALDLKSNFFLSTDYNEAILSNKSQNTQPRPKQQTSWCHYHGNVVGADSSWAAISFCDANGLNGLFQADGVTYHLLQLNPTDHVKIFIETPNYRCGFEIQTESNLTADQLKRPRRHLHDERHLLNVTRYVELVIVNDYKVYTKYGKNAEFIFERSKQIVNIVNSLYSSLNILIALVGVVIWTEKNEIEITSDSSQTLNNFLKYRRDSLIKMFPNDNAQLITGTSFESGIVGKALKQTLCTYEYSGGVNSDYSESISLVATTMAHELGHNFGMEHDNAECECAGKNCIMGPSSSFPSPRHWSSCSIKQILVGFKHGIDHCLFNKPSVLFKPSCGNGFVDPGEECDCGLPESCSSKCCDAATCKLVKGADCANGDCCDKSSCKIISADFAHVCRPAKSDCDLPEKCDGVQPYCPRDLIVKDGTECLPGYAYCYAGHCSAREQQCKLLWGKSGEVADYRCFQHNLNASSSGNCGYNKQHKTYTNCEQVKDIICGRLHCTHRSEKLEYGPEGAAIISKSVEFRKGKLVSCYSAIIDLGLYEMDPGLVPNGAKCSTNSMCVDQRCVPVNKYLLHKPCPYNCNGNGFCDNEGQCHCFDGFNSDDCSAYNNRYFLTISIYILFLLVLPLLSLSAFLFYNNQQRIKSWFRQKTLSAQDYNNQKRKKLPLNLVISGPLESGHQVTTFCSTTSQITLPSTTTPSSAVLKPIRPAPPRPMPQFHEDVEQQFSALHSEQHTLRRSSLRRPKMPPPQPPTLQPPSVCDSSIDAEDPGVKKLILMFDKRNPPS